MVDAKELPAELRVRHLNAPSIAASSNGGSMTPPQQYSVPAPQMSPVPGRTGRRLHTKVLEELKNVTRKSPVVTSAASSLPHVGNGLPPPLSLHALSVANADAPTETDTTTDGSSPRVPVAGAKSKVCGICERSFTVFRAKHTCKLCNMKICDDCSKNRAKLNRRLERRKGSRLCDPCARGYIQSTTPRLSPSETAATGDLHTNGSADSRSLSESMLGDDDGVARVAAHGIQKAASLVKTMLPTAEASTHLRQRHWISFLGLVCLMLARLVRVLDADHAPSNDDDDQVVGSILVVMLASFSAWLESLLSIRIIASYLLGLVAYDEVVAYSERRSRPSQQHLHRPCGAKTTPRQRLRSRTRSALSESARSATPTTSPTIPAVVREDEEVLEVEVGDKPVDEAGGFHLDKLLASLNECTTKNRANDGKIKTTAFLSACDSVCGFILVFGRATSFAASTVTGYISTISTNIAGWPVPTVEVSESSLFSWKEQSIRAVIAREVELQIATTGGKKKPSCARCVLRLIWFIEFVEACIRYTLIDNREESCSAGASKAYEETIGSRHPWIIRKGVNSALGSLPPRSAILESINLHELPPDDAVAQIRQAQTQMKAILTELRALLKENNLLDIK